VCDRAIVRSCDPIMDSDPVIGDARHALQLRS